jgi:hypothetical protein
MMVLVIMVEDALQAADKLTDVILIRHVDFGIKRLLNKK